LWSLNVLLAPVFAAISALLGAVSGDARRRLPITAWGHLPASLGRVKHDHLIAGGALVGDATWLLKRVSQEVALFSLSQALCAALGQHARAALASLVVGLGPRMGNQYGATVLGLS
jgi:hypothetical protein